MACLKAHRCGTINHSNEMGYKSKTPQVRLRFMFHYYIPTLDYSADGG
jgi:hypothetical protein